MAVVVIGFAKEEEDDGADGDVVATTGEKPMTE
jgi:hypothetical protein